MDKTVNIQSIEAKPFTQADVEKFIDELVIDTPILEAIAWAMDEAREDPDMGTFGNANGWRIATEAKAQYDALLSELSALRTAAREYMNTTGALRTLSGTCFFCGVDIALDDHKDDCEYRVSAYALAARLDGQG